MANKKIKDTTIKAYYSCFTALKNISTYQLIFSSVLLILGFTTNTLFLALSVIVALNIIISVIILWQGIDGIKIIKKYLNEEMD